MTKTIAQLNKDFEFQLNAACEKYLRDSIDLERYVSVTLNQMYWGDDQAYKTDCGPDWYYEIPTRHTNNGHPFVVEL